MGLAVSPDAFSFQSAGAMPATIAHDPIMAINASGNR